MIVTDNKNNSKKTTSLLSYFLKVISGIKINIVTIKIPRRTILVVSILSVFIWTVFLAYIIYRNTPKPLVTELANVVGMSVTQKRKESLESFESTLRAPLNWIKSRLFPSKIPQINIDIKFKHFQKLQHIREVAIEEKQLTQGLDDYVPAEIRTKNRNVKVKIRLKGDGIDHLLGDKWSFRIHVKGKDHLFGMRRFSIQNPGTRSFEGEPLFLNSLRREGILAPRYFFVEVVVNGKNIGLMAVEEHFSKELLESQGRREGVILKFNEFVYHEELNGTNGFFPILSHYKNVDIQPFKSKSISRSKKLTEQLKTSRGLLRGFQSGKLSASQVFDPDLMGRFIALADLWGGWHTIQWHNVRLYFNPITHKLEPIGFDGTIKESRNSFPSGYPFATDILSDENIFEIYKNSVVRITQENIDGKFLDWAKPFQEKQLRILHKDYPFLRGIDLDGLNERMMVRRDKVLNYGNDYEIIFRSYLYSEKGKTILELVNILPEPVLISSIKMVDDQGLSDLITQTPIEYPIRLSPTLVGQTPLSTIFKLNHNLKTSISSIEITAHVNHHKESKRIITPAFYHPMLKKVSIPTESINKLIQKYEFLTLNKNSKTIRVKPGKWELNDWIIIPKHLGLTINKGTEIRFGLSSGIISYSPVMINGSPDNPVVFRGLSSNKVWRGIIVSKSQGTSVWSNVLIKNTSGVKEKDWNLSGGVNFYESDIKMDHVSFIGNRSEDALNIVRSKFDLKSVTIKNTTSDGFDSDFSSGTIENSRFENIGSQGGGDGIDVSGSEVTVTNSYFKNISDKGISVGENSNLKATNIDIRNADIGIASKDGSLLFISDSKFSEIRKAGLMSYIKKPEYGSSEIMAKNITIESIGDKFISQNGSKITIDGVETSSVDLNVKNLYSPDVGQ